MLTLLLAELLPCPLSSFNGSDVTSNHARRTSYMMMMATRYDDVWYLETIFRPKTQKFTFRVIALNFLVHINCKLTQLTSCNNTTSLHLLGKIHPCKIWLLVTNDERTNWNEPNEMVVSLLISCLDKLRRGVDFAIWRKLPTVSLLWF